MMWCSWVQKRILIPEDQSTWPAWVVRHVAVCKHCRRFAEQTAAMRKWMAEPAPSAMNELAVQRIMGRVRELDAAACEAREMIGGESWTGLQWGLRLALAGAVILIIAVHVADMPTVSRPTGEVAVEQPVSLPEMRAQPVQMMVPKAPSLPRPVVVYVEPPPVSRSPRPFVVAASNEGMGVEFGGVPIMPVRFDY